jgi:hypothetical protein
MVPLMFNATSLLAVVAPTVISVAPALACRVPKATEVAVAAESVSPSDSVPVLASAVAPLRFASTVTELPLTFPVVAVVSALVDSAATAALLD